MAKLDREAPGFLPRRLSDIGFDEDDAPLHWRAASAALTGLDGRIRELTGCDGPTAAALLDVYLLHVASVVDAREVLAVATDPEALLEMHEALGYEREAEAARERLLHEPNVVRFASRGTDAPGHDG